MLSSFTRYDSMGRLKTSIRHPMRDHSIVIIRLFIDQTDIITPHYISRTAGEGSLTAGADLDDHVRRFEVSAPTYFFDIDHFALTVACFEAVAA